MHGTHSQEINYKELEMEVEYNFYKGEEAVHTLPNGDPGHPGTADTVEIQKILLPDEDGRLQHIPSLLTFIMQIGLLNEIEEILIENHEE